MNAPESRRYLIGATSGHGSGACRSMGHVDDKPLVAAQMDPTLDHVAVAVAGRGDQDAAFEPAALRTQLDRFAAEIEGHEQPLIVELPREEQQISLRGSRPTAWECGIRRVPCRSRARSSPMDPVGAPPEWRPEACPIHRRSTRSASRAT